MTVALTAAGFGALHAVSGPDHLLSLAPLSVGQGRRAWRIGLAWGLGHAAGTVVAAAVLLAVLSGTGLHVVDAWAERAAGLALVAMGAANLVALRRGRGMAAAGTRGGRRAVFTVGLVHGITGAAALLLLLPAAHASAPVKALALAGFAAGSTAAMAALTAAIAALSAAAAPRLALATRRLPVLASVASVAVGIGWAIAA